MNAQTALLPDGRQHLHHGPIDLIITADGPGRQTALSRAKLRFAPLLDELVGELSLLRSQAGTASLTGDVALRMAAAVDPFRPAFITPMAAVAGAVADEILSAMRAPDLTRIIVNNGGDIALHLVSGQNATAAVAGTPLRLELSAGTHGIATSGWRGRSLSLGIADSVTVLAETAAAADAAATMIANAVDLPGHPAITRQPACDLFPDSDLRDRRVTTGVGPLTERDIARALAAGTAAADRLIANRRIHGAALTLAGHMRTTGHVPFKELTHA